MVKKQRPHFLILAGIALVALLALSACGATIDATTAQVPAGLQAATNRLDAPVAPVREAAPADQAAPAPDNVVASAAPVAEPRRPPPTSRPGSRPPSPTSASPCARISATAACPLWAWAGPSTASPIPISR